MAIKYIVFLLFLAASLFSQSFIKTFGGSTSGMDRVTAVTTDAAGNIYATGTTRSFEFPATANAFQSTNRGTQLTYSLDAGLTWQPLGNVISSLTSFPDFIPIAVDPKNAEVIYIGGADRVYRSNDHGLHRIAGDPLPGPGTSMTIGIGVTAIAVDPFQSTTVYAGRNYSGIYKSVDGGKVWMSAGVGLPANSAINSIRPDPFHAGVLFAWVGGRAFRSGNGGVSWTTGGVPLPAVDRIVGNGVDVIFDPVQPGVIYAPTPSGFFKTTDNGQTWSALTTPFKGLFSVAVDPKIANTLYAAVNVGSINAGNGIWKSTDGGRNWNQIHPGLISGPISVDPADSNILIAGNLRSTDGGGTFQKMSVSRQITAVFAPSGKGAVYGSGTETSDAFLMKLSPTGDKVLYSTYFGGQGIDTASAIAVDHAGNIFVAGNTFSSDLPVTPDAVQRTMNGTSDAFVAKFAVDGSLLYATYLGGNGDDAAKAIALDSAGNALVAGLSRTEDGQVLSGFVTKIDTVGGQVLYSFSMDGTDFSGVPAVAVDSADNALITGTTLSPSFPVTDDVTHGPVPSQLGSKAFVVKLDPLGKTVYLTYFGGSVVADPRQRNRETGVAIATDVQGNAYVTGNTAASDFPVTTGAFQQKTKAICPYPAFSNGTGFIGTIYTYLGDDVFVTKLSPDGKQLLFSTLLGGQCYDRPTGIAVDSSGSVYVTGETNSTDFPTVASLDVAGPAGVYQSFISRLSADTGSLLFSTYLSAGSSPSIALKSSGAVIVGGATGPGSQTSASSSFLNPFPDISTRDLVRLIDPSASPGITLSAVRNAFSLRAGPVTPGEILSLAVTGLQPTASVDIGLNQLAPLSTSLAETEVLFDGKPGNLVSVMPGRVVCIAPMAGASRIEVRFRGMLSNAFFTDGTRSDLGLLTADGSGTGPANVRNVDGSLNSNTNPAAVGSVVTLFVTGLGVDVGLGLTTSVGPALSVTPLQGFVPGIFAVRVVASAGSTGIAEVNVRDGGSVSQTTYFFVY